MESEGQTEPTGTAEEAPVDTSPDVEADAAVPQDDTPWSLDEVDEGIRPDVERWINSARPAMTRKFQEAAELRKEAEAAIALQEALASPDTAYESLSEVLSNYGIDLPQEVWEQATNGTTPDAAESYGYDDDDADGEPDGDVDRRLQALEQKHQEEGELRERQVRVQHVNQFYAGLAQARGYGETVDEVPDEVRNVVASIAAVMPYNDDGLPDMQGAQELAEAFAAHEIERYLKAKPKGNGPPKGGGPGERRADLSNTEERLKVASEVAARHFA